MQVYDGGYNGIQFNSKLLRETAQAIAARLPTLMAELDAGTIVVTGKSGVSLGFAVAMLLDFPLVVVRKSGEASHGSDVEGPNGHIVGRYIVLDDFVQSGTTIRTIADKLSNRASTSGLAPVECVGVLCYSGQYDSPRWLTVHGLNVPVAQL